MRLIAIKYFNRLTALISTIALCPQHNVQNCHAAFMCYHTKKNFTHGAAFAGYCVTAALALIQHDHFQ